MLCRETEKKFWKPASTAISPSQWIWSHWPRKSSTFSSSCGSRDSVRTRDRTNCPIGLVGQPLTVNKPSPHHVSFSLRRSYVGRGYLCRRKARTWSTSDEVGLLHPHQATV